MTDTDDHDRRGKRERLVTSAGDLLHRQGVLGTTLAEVAQAADVPPGNVYYFTTKDELVRAVIDSRTDQVRAMLGSFETRRSPGARLKALAHRWAEMGELIARYGCPFGTLSSELDRREDGLDRQAAKPIGLILEWAETQFRQLGRRDPRESVRSPSSPACKAVRCWPTRSGIRTSWPARYAISSGGSTRCREPVRPELSVGDVRDPTGSPAGRGPDPGAAPRSVPVARTTRQQDRVY